MTVTGSGAALDVRRIADEYEESVVSWREPWDKPISCVGVALCGRRGLLECEGTCSRTAGATRSSKLGTYRPSRDEE
jgi:hypothetical protein